MCEVYLYCKMCNACVTIISHLSLSLINTSFNEDLLSGETLICDNLNDMQISCLHLFQIREPQLISHSESLECFAIIPLWRTKLNML